MLNDYPVAYTVNRFSAILQKHSIETVLDWHDCEKQNRNEFLKSIEKKKVNDYCVFFRRKLQNE